jgi:hypothetical protein
MGLQLRIRLALRFLKESPSGGNVGSDGHYICVLTSAFCRTALSAQRRSEGVGHQRAVRPHATVDILHCHVHRYQPTNPLTNNAAAPANATAHSL